MLTYEFRHAPHATRARPGANLAACPASPTFPLTVNENVNLG